MKAYASFSDWKKDQSPQNIRLIGALTKIIEAAAPRLTKAVKWGQGCWLDGDAPKVFIHAAADHVQLGFYRGSALKDPQKLLVGDGAYVRHVKVRAARDIEPAAFAGLVRQACGRPEGGSVSTAKKAKTKAKAGAGAGHRLYAYPFARIYPLWLQKVERKARTKKELDQVLSWLTGYTAAGLQKQVRGEDDLETFFAKAPAFNPAAKLITGKVCGVRVEEIADPVMRKIRQADKLIDELAQGRVMEKILRQDA